MVPTHAPGRGVLLACLALLTAGPALAQDVPDERSFDVQLFRAPLGPRGFITIDSAHVPAHKQFGISLVSNYQRGAFSLSVDSERPELANRFDVVESQYFSELTGAVGLFDRVELGLGVPLTLRMTGQDYTPTGQPLDEPFTASGIGDLRVEAKVAVGTFGPADEFMFAVIPGITLPTGDGQYFLGEGGVAGRLRAITEYRMEDVRAAAMIGFLGRGTSQTFKSEIGSQLLYGVALEYQVHRQVALLGEWSGRVGSMKYVDVNPAEVDVGMRVGLPAGLTVAFGGGAGVNRGIGAPTFRGFLALAWAPDFRDRDGDGVYDAEDRCPEDPEDVDGFKDADGCPDPDNDGDRIADAQDKCPNAPEDYDQFEDEDGCPEEDNDKDGIPDLRDPCPNAAEDGRGKRPTDGCPSSAEDQDGDGINDANDKCPDEPEDRDGHQDYDGCPDIDNDGDTIPDEFDACPNDAEDADGFEDDDGCPDPDNDRDGIPDALDKCPMQPETLNGNRDDDGCPDPGVEIVRLAGDRIELRERITFTGAGALTGGGQAVVNLVAMVLRGHHDLEKVRIEVTADNAGQAQTRAEAVQAALVRAGVQAHRLRAVGAGGGGNKVEFLVEARAEKKKPPAAAPQ